MIIGLIGNKYAGKDTAGDYLVSEHEFVKISFATPIKVVCKYLFSLTEEQLHDPLEKEKIEPYWNMTPRQMFQKVGTDLFRNHFDPDFWIKQLESKHLVSNDGSNIVCCDVRYPNEANLIKKYKGILIKIERNTGKSDAHESEKNIDTIHHDYLIENNSTIETLHENLEKILRRIHQS